MKRLIFFILIVVLFLLGACDDTKVKLTEVKMQDWLFLITSIMK